MLILLLAASSLLVDARGKIGFKYFVLKQAYWRTASLRERTETNQQNSSSLKLTPVKVIKWRTEYAYHTGDRFN